MIKILKNNLNKIFVGVLAVAMLAGVGVALKPGKTVKAATIQKDLLETVNVLAISGTELQFSVYTDPEYNIPSSFSFSNNFSLGEVIVLESAPSSGRITAAYVDQQSGGDTLRFNYNKDFNSNSLDCLYYMSGPHPKTVVSENVIQVALDPIFFDYPKNSLVLGETYYIVVNISGLISGSLSSCWFIHEFDYVANSVPLPTPPEIEGETFVGWYWDTDFTIPYRGEPLYNDADLYALYSTDICTVTFNTNGGSAVSSVQLNAGTAYTPAVKPTRAGYGFDGWFRDSGLAIPYINGTVVMYNITLYAKWIKLCTVTFIVKGDVFAQIDVLAGVSFYKVNEQINAATGSTVSFYNVSMTGLVTDDVIIYGTTGETAAAQIKGFFAENWYWFTIGGVAFAGLIVFGVLFGGQAGKAGYRRR